MWSLHTPAVLRGPGGRDQCSIPLAGAEDGPACCAVVGGGDRFPNPRGLLYDSRSARGPEAQRPECRFGRQRHPFSVHVMGWLLVVVALVAELEAESVAFVVCDDLGLDSSAYSFGYIATWAGGGEDADRAISASAQRINKAARTILEHLESGARR